MTDIRATVRDLIAAHARLNVDAQGLQPSADLYAAGMSSFASVQLMLALEEAFDLEFPERMLNRRSFSSIASIEAAVNELLSEMAKAS